MAKITRSMVRSRLDRLNRLAPDQIPCLTVGALVLNVNATGYGLARIVNPSGGQRSLDWGDTLRAIWHYLDGYEDGMRQCANSH